MIGMIKKITLLLAFFPLILQPAQGMERDLNLGTYYSELSAPQRDFVCKYNGIRQNVRYTLEDMEGEAFSAPWMESATQPYLITFISGFETNKSLLTPNGWQLVPDPQQKRGTKVPLSVVKKEDSEHVVLQGDGYVFYYPLIMEEMKKLDAQSFIFEADVWSNVQGAYLQY